MMRKWIMTLAAALLAPALYAQEFAAVPAAWKWIASDEVAFTFNGSYTDEGAFSVKARTHALRTGIQAPGRFTAFPFQPAGAVNMTYSPDSTMIAFTRDNDLYVVNTTTGAERRLTFDGSDLILNGYASWVYYEEILGRSSQYKSFWWSPDSRKIGYYRFDNTGVPMFPIYSADGQDGSLRLTRYPKAGEQNPQVRIGMVDVASGATVWADFDETEDQYFGIPFWGADSREFYVAREPRVQNTLDLYAVSAADGSKRAVYHEEYATWLDWMDNITFTERGLYMVRSFESGWEQLYFLSYDGALRRLTDGPNWDATILRVDEKKGDVYFQARRDATVRYTLYKVDAKGRITALTDPAFNVTSVRFSPDGRWFVAALSNFTTPTQVWLCETAQAAQAWQDLAAGKQSRAARTAYKVADMAGAGFDASRYALARNISIPAEDGLEMHAYIVYPKDFDPARKYPVHFEIYGGPNTKYCTDRWVRPTAENQWWSEQGIIHICADVRASGHNGRAGTDGVHRDLVSAPVRDFCTWARYMQGLPYVRADRIGVEGFSFGGTMTSMLVMTHGDLFRCGIAGGGVYDWMLYDTHYTERFMDTPQRNPEGYRRAAVLNHVEEMGSGVLKLTHGTGDDNVHFQNTLQLVDALQAAGKQFELMIYPDGMHGYRGAQHQHSVEADHAFWTRNLLD